MREEERIAPRKLHFMLGWREEEEERERERGTPSLVAMVTVGRWEGEARERETWVIVACSLLP